MTTIVDGNALSREIREGVRESFAELARAGVMPPRVAIVQFGDDPAATQYTRRLQRTFGDAGAAVNLHELPASATEEEAARLVRELSRSRGIHGIQIQTPLPLHVSLASVLDPLDPAKDLDGIHPRNAGLLAQGHPFVVPATPLGGLEILIRHRVEVAGARAVVVGRSAPVGRPMALLLLQHHATVTICHTRTRGLDEIVRQADIVAVAAGHPGLISADMVKPGAAVIDFGTNVVDGKTLGDVDPAAAERAGLFTPVPGGTGPVTNAMLLRNALTLYRSAMGAPAP